MDACVSALKAGDPGDCVEALQNYVSANDGTFHFNEEVPLISKFVSAITQYVAEEESSAEGRRLALHALRILTRQKSGFESILNEEGAKCLLGFAGFGYKGDQFEWGIMVEALKCLCNLTFQHQELSPVIVAIEGSISYILHLVSWKDTEYSVRFYASRFIFLVSAVNPASRSSVQKKKGLRCLCDGVLIALGITQQEAGLQHDSAKIDELSKEGADLSAEMLKTVFNISMEVAKAEATPEEAQAVAELVQITRIILSSRALMDRDDMSTLRSQVTYIMINMPRSSSAYFTPRSHSQFSTEKVVVFEHRDVTAPSNLMRHLEKCVKDLDGARITTAAGDGIVPIMTALANCARACGPARRFWRARILPTLRTVDCRPDQGETLKARLVRLMTSSHTTLSSTVADFLFVLCKENAGRLVKHTGYGNAAGLLLQRGLLSGGSATPSGDYSSESSDSDTEEYRESSVNVMTGGPEARDQADPFAGMTEEQKEAEAEKLGELFQKLEDTGVMKVMRVGDKQGDSKDNGPSEG